MVFRELARFDCLSGSSERRSPTLIVTSAAKASRHLLSKSRGSSIKCVISIGEPGEKRPAGFSMPRARLRLEFADTIDESEPGVHSTRDDIKQLIAFAATVCSSTGSTLIHCQAGISRSTAAAFIILAVSLGAGQEEEAFNATLALVPQARPNRRMVQFADELLERGGALLRALDPNRTPPE